MEKIQLKTFTSDRLSQVSNHLTFEEYRKFCHENVDDIAILIFNQN